ncbi:MAG: hypothetical protein AAF629_36350, partial [Chloroflexota bacterium]
MAVTVLPWFGFGVEDWGLWRLWPISIIAVGTAFVMTPIRYDHRRSLGGMFIPGMPILMAGTILFFASVFDNFDIWESVWPLMPLSLAIGFFFAGLRMRVAGLVFPTMIIGLISLALLFTAMTDLWEAWAVLWMVVPFSVALSLMVYGRKNRRLGMRLFAVTGVGFLGLSLLLSGWWVISLLVSSVFLLAGASLLTWHVRHYLPSPQLFLDWADSVG